MDILKEVLKHRKPALQLVASTNDSAFSKIGGLPCLPSNEEWPTWNGKSLAFIAQISLEELSFLGNDEADSKPGCLFFFYDQEQSTWGFDPKDAGSWKVIYSEDPGACTSERSAPKDLDDDAQYDAKRVVDREIQALPTIERLEIDFNDVSEEVFEEIEDLFDEPYGDNPRHQIGGFPYVVQNDSMELEAQLASNGFYLGDATGYNDPRAKELNSGAKDWELLLQIDSDDDTGMMWGDCGLIYFWIKSEDLKARNFDSVWMILQCS